MSLIKAMQNGTITTNGMAAFKSTLNPNLDFFTIVADARNLDVSSLFSQSLEADEEVTFRTLLWARDVRGGAGERQTFRALLKHAAETTVIPLGVLFKVPEVGRWDDLFVLLGTEYEETVMEMIHHALLSQDGLCAKWMPRQGPIANKIRTYLNMSPKQWRKTLVGLTDVVEQKMCANSWDSITYKHVPSKAIAKYAKAFTRNDGERYGDFKAAAVRGEVKVNASAIFPCDIVHNSQYDDTQLAEAQWKNLPDYCEGSDQRILSVVDVSGSMISKVDAKSSVNCMDVAISLGIYTAERMQGAFHNSFITFTDRPRIITFNDKDTLRQKIDRSKTDVGYSTNIEGVFDAVLKAAVQNAVPEDQMPTKILIMSDMQFNSQIRDFNTSCIEMIRKKYAKAGYNMPQIVYWNIGAGKYDNKPITAGMKDTVMVNGFSPSILKSILKGSDSSVDLMMQTVMVDRYNYDLE